MNKKLKKQVKQYVEVEWTKFVRDDIRECVEGIFDELVESKELIGSSDLRELRESMVDTGSTKELIESIELTELKETIDLKAAKMEELHETIVNAIEEMRKLTSLIEKSVVQF